MEGCNSLSGAPPPTPSSRRSERQTTRPCSKPSLDHLRTRGQGPPLGRPCGVLLSAASPAPRPAPLAVLPAHAPLLPQGLCTCSPLPGLLTSLLTSHQQSPSLGGLPDPLYTAAPPYSTALYSTYLHLTGLFVLGLSPGQVTLGLGFVSRAWCVAEAQQVSVQNEWGREGVRPLQGSAGSLRWMEHGVVGARLCTLATSCEELTHWKRL